MLAHPSGGRCDRFAAPGGSNSARGTRAAPLRTAQALVRSLRPGQVGCLEAGTYTGGLRFHRGGRPGARIVVRGYPEQSALVIGRIVVARGANYVTVADLRLDGSHQGRHRHLPSPTIDANHVSFEADDVTNDHTEICFDVGSESGGIANGTTIANDHVHDCGVLPAENHDHGIYVQDAIDTRIVGNVIDRNADRGIQLYPRSLNATITGNVISDNGEGIIFSGDGGVASSGNVVEHNLIVASTVRSDVESWYPDGNPKGRGNVVRENCVSSGGIDTSNGGFLAQSNVTAGPGELVATEPGVYRPLPGSRCASVVPTLASAGGNGGS